MIRVKLTNHSATDKVKNLSSCCYTMVEWYLGTNAGEKTLQAPTKLEPNPISVSRLC